MNLKWELKTTERKRKHLMLVIGSDAKGLKTYPCNRWGYGYWLWRVKNDKMAWRQRFGFSQRG